MNLVDDKRKVEFNGKTYVTWHGSPFDRGGADSWYSRPKQPHWYPEGSYKGNRIDTSDMTADEVDAYNAGYEYNEQLGGKKEWD